MEPCPGLTELVLAEIRRKGVRGIEIFRLRRICKRKGATTNSFHETLVPLIREGEVESFSKENSTLTYLKINSDKLPVLEPDF